MEGKPSQENEGNGEEQADEVWQDEVQWSRETVDIYDVVNRGIGCRVPSSKRQHHRDCHIEELIVQGVLGNIEEWICRRGRRVLSKGGVKACVRDDCVVYANALWSCSIFCMMRDRTLIDLPPIEFEVIGWLHST